MPRRWWLRLRLALPWWLFRMTRPAEPLVLDWRYGHGWGRTPGPHRQIRPYWDRALPQPDHTCFPVCQCFDELLSRTEPMQSWAPRRRQGCDQLIID